MQPSSFSFKKRYTHICEGWYLSPKNRKRGSMMVYVKRMIVLGVLFVSTQSFALSEGEKKKPGEATSQPTIAEQIAQKEHEIEHIKQTMSKQRQQAQRSVENASDALEREAQRFADRRKEIKLPEDYDDLEGWEATKEKVAVIGKDMVYATAEYATKGAQLFLDWVVHPLAVHPKSVKPLWELGKLEVDVRYLKREQGKVLKEAEKDGMKAPEKTTKE